MAPVAAAESWVLVYSGQKVGQGGYRDHPIGGTMCPHCVIAFFLSLPFVAKAVHYLYQWYKTRRTECRSDHVASHLSEPHDSSEQCSKCSSPLDQM